MESFLYVNGAKTQFSAAGVLRTVPKCCWLVACRPGPQCACVLNPEGAPEVYGSVVVPESKGIHAIAERNALSGTF